MKIACIKITKWIIPILLFLLLAFDGNTHWDENNYLEKAAYAPLDLQASWIQVRGGFYTGRLFHIFILRFLFILFGIGPLPLIGIECSMALMVLLSGAIFYLTVRSLGLDKETSFWVFIVFLFSPLSLYLAYKALAETTALFLSAAAIFCFVRGLKHTGRKGWLLIILSALALFLATYSRIESLLTFGAFSFAVILFGAPQRKNAFKKYVIIFGIWGGLTLAVGLFWKVWGLQFIFTRATTMKYVIAKDLMDKSPNYVFVLLFGGSMWLFVVMALLRLKEKRVKLGMTSLILTVLPLSIYHYHLEIRYLSPAIFGFALAAGLGLKQIHLYLKQKFNLLIAGWLLVIIFISAVGSNQIIRPLYAVGVEAVPLFKLNNRLQAQYDDPLITTSSVPNTYAFLRVVFPGVRIASLTGFLGIPLDIKDYNVLIKEREPWIFLSTKGKKEMPLISRLWNYLRGKGKVEESFGLEKIWILSSPRLKSEVVDQEGRYRAYLVEKAE